MPVKKIKHEHYWKQDKLLNKFHLCYSYLIPASLINLFQKNVSPAMKQKKKGFVP